MARGRKMKAGARSAVARLSGSLSWRYGRDLTDAAKRGQLDPVIGREEELARLIQILGRKTKNNPVLIGKSGVGKTAIVEGLALRIAEGMVPPGLHGKRVVSLDLATMLAGARIRGEFEERLKSALALLAVSKGRVPARPLRRVLQRDLGDRLAVLLLDGTFHAGTPSRSAWPTTSSVSRSEPSLPAVAVTGWLVRRDGSGQLGRARVGQ
jgi:ATP-dependent Clp protease ATP-binding subunit ClpA